MTQQVVRCLICGGEVDKAGIVFIEVDWGVCSKCNQEEDDND